MSQEDNVVYLNRTRPRATPHEVYARVRRLVVDKLAGALAAMLDQADDSLFGRAEKSPDGRRQAEFFTAMRIVRLSRRELETCFRDALLANFDRLGGAAEHDPAGMADDELDLSLVDNEKLEESIAVDGMIAKARARNAPALVRLRAGLASALPDRDIDENNSPLDPAQIARAFTAAAERLQIEIGARLIVYKLFDQHVLGALPAVYQAAERIVVQSGLQPGRRRQPPTPVGHVARVALRDTTAAEAATLFDVLSRLLQGEAGGGTGAGGNGTAGDGGAGTASGEAVVQLSDLIALLSLMQRDATGEPAQTETVKSALGELLARRCPGRCALGPVEDAAIDIVGMLFDAILADPQLPAALKVLIARLQIPVLKVALLDGSFFGSSLHPARRLINEIAAAALGWVEPAQVERDPLYRRIDGIVQRVLSEFDDRVDLFDDLLDDFLLFLEEERERARLVEERTRQAAEGKAKVDGAKLRVDEEIRLRTAGRQVPAVVRSLLEGPWSKVLFLAYLKEGDAGDAWQRQLRVVDRLVASVQPKRSAQERRELLTEIPALLHDLREGLNEILFNPYEMTTLFKGLEAEHIRCLAAADVQLEVRVEPAPARPAEAVTEEADLSEQLDRLDGVPPGTWFELEQPNGSRLRAKLSARLGDPARLIFVNRAGFKIAEWEPRGLAAELRDGRAVVLDDGLLFDRALETVYANLQSAQG